MMPSPLKLTALLGLLAGAACSPPPSRDPSRMQELESRLESLEKELAAVKAELATTRDLAQDHAISSAASLINSVDFVELSARLSQGRGIRTSDAPAIAGLVRAIQHVEWPPEIRPEAEQATHVLVEFRDALAGRDEERAAGLSGQAKAYQRMLTREVDRWLAAVSPWSPHMSADDVGSHGHADGVKSEAKTSTSSAKGH